MSAVVQGGVCPGCCQTTDIEAGHRLCLSCRNRVARERQASRIGWNMRPRPRKPIPPPLPKRPIPSEHHDGGRAWGPGDGAVMAVLMWAVLAAATLGWVFTR